jgi:hypothetical protein
MVKLTYCPKHVVGNWGEELVAGAFDLVRADREFEGRVPDLIDKKGRYCVEVKASHYQNGGVIKIPQINGFGSIYELKRFYAFVFHTVEGITKRGLSESQLVRELHAIGIYIFPYSVVLKHCQTSHLKKSPDSEFGQLDMNLAHQIIHGNTSEWERLGLDNSEYEVRNPHPRVYIMTHGRNLQKVLLGSFDRTKI